jgi:hypothetical protein
MAAAVATAVTTAVAVLEEGRVYILFLTCLDL